MPQAAQRIEEEYPILSDVAAVGDAAPKLEQKIEIVQAVRGRSRDRGLSLDRFLVERLTHMAEGLAGARASQGQLKQLLDTLVAPPWFPAILDELIPTAAGVRAVVVHNSVARLVTLADDVDASALAPGDEVYLSHELNVVVGKSPSGVRYGETARF